MAKDKTPCHTPNTMIDESLLSENIILCCGEDATEMLKALSDAGAPKPTRFHEYRSYQVRKYPDFTVILAGIGTGCLEPLLYEILCFGIAKRLVLVGTAGKTQTSNLSLGEVYVIRKAYLAGTGLDREIKDLPLTPNFPLADKCEDVSVLSADFYYGFTQAPQESAYHRQLEHLKKDVDTYMQKVDLIDMEVGQFYALCRLMAAPSSIEYVAIKGPANVISEQQMQPFNTREVLTKAFRRAFELLNIEMISDGRQTPRQSQTLPVANGSKKMIEEIKLYWTIQIAIASMLGFLATNIDMGKMGATCLICFPAFLLLTIGAIYNLVGNYYIALEGASRGSSRMQENIITPHLCVLYWAIGAVLGALLGYCFGSVLYDWLKLGKDLQFLPSRMAVYGAIGGWGLVYLTERRTYQDLCKSGPKQYTDYSQVLKKIFFHYPTQKKEETKSKGGVATLILLTLLAAWYAIGLIGVPGLVSSQFESDGSPIFLALVLAMCLLIGIYYFRQRYAWGVGFLLCLLFAWLNIQFELHWRHFIFPPVADKLQKHIDSSQFWHLIPKSSTRIVPDGYHTIMFLLIAAAIIVLAIPVIKKLQRSIAASKQSN